MDKFMGNDENKQSNSIENERNDILFNVKIIKFEDIIARDYIAQATENGASVVNYRSDDNNNETNIIKFANIVSDRDENYSTKNYYFSIVDNGVRETRPISTNGEPIIKFPEMGTIIGNDSKAYMKYFDVKREIKSALAKINNNSINKTREKSYPFDTTKLQVNNSALRQNNSRKGNQIFEKVNMLAYRMVKKSNTSEEIFSRLGKLDECILRYKEEIDELFAIYDMEQEVAVTKE